MEVSFLMHLLLESFEGSESSLEPVCGKVLEKAQLDVPSGRSVCFFNHGWDQLSGLQASAIKTATKVSFTHFNLQKSVDVSGTCALNVLLFIQLSNLEKLFKSFSLDKYSKFIIIIRDSMNSIDFARFLLTQGITNMLFLEQTGSSVNMYTYNLLTEKINRSLLDADLFPDKLSKLSGYPYTVITLFSRIFDSELEYVQYIHLNLLNFIITHQNATRKFRVMHEKVFPDRIPFFDVIVPYIDFSKFKNSEMIHQLPLPFSTTWCLIVPKVQDPRFLMILFRPFQFQLWVFVIIGYCMIYWIHIFLTFHFANCLPSKLPSFKRMKILALEFCLFILCESYSAKLTAYLNSPIDTVYPKSLAEFRSSPMQLLISQPEFLVYPKMMPVLNGKYTLFNQSMAYDWNQVALIDRCNILEDQSVPEPQGEMGVVFSSSRYHVINEPLAVLKFPMLFNKRSPLERVASQIINRMYEAGLWQGFMKAPKREAGKSSHDVEAKAPDAFYGFMPVFRTMGNGWIFSILLFALQWIYVKFLRQIHYSIMFLIGLSVFLRN